jgi:hypothetical protein
MNRSHYVVPRRLLAVWGLLFFLSSVAAQTALPVRTLEGLVGRWVDLQGQVAEEQRTWNAQSAQWQQEMDLLRQEQDSLATALARLEQAGETQQKRRADLLERREHLRAAIAGVDGVLQRLQPAVASLAVRVPASLMTPDLSAALQPTDAAAAETQGGVSARLQRTLGALTAIETLQARVHVTRAMIALPNAPRREMDVIFIGLACGYAVTADDRLAAAGRPTPDGWRWEPLSSDATAVRRLIQVANQDIAPVLVTFPIGIAAGAERGAAE